VARTSPRHRTTQWTAFGNLVPDGFTCPRGGDSHDLSGFIFDVYERHGHGVGKNTQNVCHSVEVEILDTGEPSRRVQEQLAILQHTFVETSERDWSCDAMAAIGPKGILVRSVQETGMFDKCTLARTRWCERPVGPSHGGDVQSQPFRREFPAPAVFRDVGYRRCYGVHWLAIQRRRTLHFVVHEAGVSWIGVNKRLRIGERP